MMKMARKLVPQSFRTNLKKRLKNGRNAPDEAAAAATGVAETEDIPINPLPPALIKLSAAKTRVSIDKARRLLGYEPRFSFEAGMALTGEWARWANLTDV